MSDRLASGWGRGIHRTLALRQLSGVATSVGRARGFQLNAHWTSEQASDDRGARRGGGSECPLGRTFARNRGEGGVRVHRACVLGSAMHI